MKRTLCLRSQHLDIVGLVKNRMNTKGGVLTPQELCNNTRAVYLDYFDLAANLSPLKYLSQISKCKIK